MANAMIRGWAEWAAFLTSTKLGGPIAFLGSMAFAWMLTNRIEQWRKARRKR